MGKLYPLLMKPALRPMVWGGNKLSTKYPSKKGNEPNIGESWEIACRNDLWSVVDNGSLKGRSFPEVFSEYSKEILGYEGNEFPWLIKFIDAGKDLSVQVHPDDEYAKTHNDFSGKTEMWYIIDADENSRLVLDFKEEADKATIRKKAEDGSIIEILNEIPVKEGDSFFIPPGTVHAIGGGIVLLEIQQNSDATYRLYDWGRVGSDGKPRELHLDKATDVIRIKATASKNGDEICKCLAKCEYFAVDKVKLHGKKSIKGMSVVISLKGELSIGDLDLKEGDSVLIPACLGEITISGEGEFAFVYMP